MTALPPEPPREPAVIPDQRLVPILRDVGAMILLVLGIVGILWVGFSTSFKAGLGVLSVISIVAGLALAWRDPRDDDAFRHNVRRR